MLDFTEQIEASKLLTVDGEYSGQCLNPNLIISKGLDLESVQILVDLHFMKEMIYRDIRATDDKDELFNLGMLLMGVEFGMQKAWKFKEDHTMHTHDLAAPKCECPKMDNYEWRGYKRIVAGDCPLHFNNNYYAEMQKELEKEREDGKIT